MLITSICSLLLTLLLALHCVDPISLPHSTFTAISEETLQFPSDRSEDMAERDTKRAFGNTALGTLQVNLGIKQATENIVTSRLISFYPLCSA